MLYLENVSPTDAQKIREAVKQIADRPENRGNAFTNLILARVQLEETANKPALMHPATEAQVTRHTEETRRNISDAEWQLVKSAKLASGVGVLTGKVDAATINRADAAWVNKQAAVILRQTGNEAEANYRERIGRFFEVDEAERKTMSAALELTIPRVKAGDLPSVRAANEAERELYDYQKDRAANYKEPKINFNFKEDPFKREWKVPSVWGESTLLRFVDKKTDAVVPLVRYNMGKGSIKFSGIEKPYEGQKLINQRGEEVRQGREYTLNVKKNGEPVQPRDGFVHKNPVFGEPRSVESTELSPKSVSRSFQFSGVGSAIGQWNAAMRFGADYKYGITQKKIEQGQELEKAVFNADNYPVPPRPKDLPREREQLQRIYGTDKKAEAHINLLMQRLEEQSYAFWGSK